jgi:hypothetical protein
MIVSKELVKSLCEMQGLHVPAAEMDNVAIRLSTWMSAMEQIEADMGALIQTVDPIPPVFPKEDI